MRLDSWATFRKAIPAAAVGAVLALSYVMQVPSLASNAGSGYGYANNCGVKGDGFHDHGKLCPNRPFPGKGKGVASILGGAAISGHHLNSKHSQTSTTDADAKTPSTAPTDSALGSRKGHDHGKGHSHGRGLSF